MYERDKKKDKYIGTVFVREKGRDRQTDRERVFLETQKEKV